jgi:hypothetical protein
MSEEARVAAVMEVRLSRVEQGLSDYNRKIENSMRKASRDIESANDNWSKLFGQKPNLAKALDGVIDNTRLKVLDSGVARVGLLGSALENLGPYGLVAAGGIAAVVGALAQARSAAAFGDEIGDTAGRLHVTTDALQEYRYAIRLAGGEEKGADDALESFSATLGKAQAGLSKAQKPFKELGFTKAQIDGFKTVEDGLVAVTGRIENLGSNVQKDAVIDQFGLNGLKPLIEGGLDNMQRLKAEAQSLGLVMDAGLIARAGEANDKFETLEKVIDVQLKSAFVDLAPVLLNLLSIAADFAKEFADVVAGFEKIENRATNSLQRQRDQLAGMIDRGTKAPEGAFEHLDAGEQARLRKRLSAMDAELAQRATTAAANAPTVPNGSSLIDLDAIAKAEQARLKALQRAASSQQLIDDATRNELQARRALVHDLFEQAVLAGQEVDADAERKANRIAADLAQGKITKAAADTATALNRRATDEQKAAIAADLTTRLEQDRLSKHRELASILDATTSIYSSLARTAEERRKLELKLLEKQHQDRVDELSTRRNQAGREGRLDDVDALGRQIDAESDNYGASRKQVLQQTMGPAAAWIDSLPQSIGELNEAFEALDVQGIQGLTSGLADAIVNSKSLGATASNVFKQLEIQVLQMLLEIAAQKAATALGLPGFAIGGYTGPGAANEARGVVHAGEVVFDQPAVSRLGVPFLEALRKGKIPGFAKGGPVGFSAPNLPSLQSLGRSTVVQQFFPNFSGAVMTEDLLQQFKSYADSTASRAALQGAQGGAALARQQAQKSATNRLGVRRS